MIVINYSKKFLDIKKDWIFHVDLNGPTMQ